MANSSAPETDVPTRSGSPEGQSGEASASCDQQETDQYSDVAAWINLVPEAVLIVGAEKTKIKTVNTLFKQRIMDFPEITNLLFTIDLVREQHRPSVLEKVTGAVMKHRQQTQQSVVSS